MAWTSARRWMPRRFSTWAMLVLFVLALPWVVRIGWAHLRYRQQAAAIAELGRLGVLVESEEATPIVIRRHLPVSIRRVWVRPTVLQADTHIATNATLALIGQLPSLSELDISHGDFDETGVAHLRACRELTRLNLAHTPITSDQLLLLLPLPKLKSLTLTQTKVDDAVMPAVCEHKGLDRLILGRTGITGKSVHLLDQLPKLDTLIFSGNDIKDEELAGLKVLASLDTLSLRDTGACENTIRAIVAKGNVRRLILGGSIINDDILKMIGQMPTIHLEISRSPVTIDAAVQFVQPPGKRKITLHDCKIDYGQLMAMYPHAKGVVIYDTPMTD